MKGGSSGGTDWFVTPTSKPLDRTPGKTGGGASSKKVFGSLERGLDKMKNMLTPRYLTNSQSCSSGSVIKNMDPDACQTALDSYHWNQP